MILVEYHTTVVFIIDMYPAIGHVPITATGHYWDHNREMHMHINQASMRQLQPWSQHQDEIINQSNSVAMYVKLYIRTNVVASHYVKPETNGWITHSWYITYM